MRYRIKVCGITKTEDALYAEELGAYAIGFIFYPKSPRYIEPEKAAQIAEKIKIKKVGVFVNENPEIINNISKIVKLDYVQLHGTETAAECNAIQNKIIKNIRTVDDIKTYNSACMFLVDAPDTKNWGGTGKIADWSFARKVKQSGKTIMLSGGLSVDNIEKAISYVQPDYIDISSSLEKSPGIKDHGLMKRFFDKINIYGENRND